ncbi:MAG: hypothetical protein R3F30_08095 [Planctomycetota bacterium]
MTGEGSDLEALRSKLLPLALLEAGQDAEDILHEALLRFVQERRRLEALGTKIHRPLAWLRKAVIRRARRHQARTARISRRFDRVMEIDRLGLPPRDRDEENEKLRTLEWISWIRAHAEELCDALSPLLTELQADVLALTLRPAGLQTVEHELGRGKWEIERVLLAVAKRIQGRFPQGILPANAPWSRSPRSARPAAIQPLNPSARDGLKGHAADADKK